MDTQSPSTETSSTPAASEAPKAAPEAEGAGKEPADAAASAETTETQANGETAQKALLLDPGDAGDDSPKEEVTGEKEAVAEVKAEDAVETKEAAKEGEDKPEETPAADEKKDGDEAEAKEVSDEIKHWRELIKDAENAKVLDRFDTPDEIVSKLRELINFQRRAVLPPNKNSTPEEVTRYRKMMSIPDSPEGYEIEVDKNADDGDKALIERLKDTAHGLHLTPTQLREMIGFQKTEAAAAEQRDIDALENFRKDVRTEIARNWGPDYQKKWQLGINYAKEIYGGYAEDFMTMKLEDGTMVGDHPVQIMAMAKGGGMFGEAGIPGQGKYDNFNPTRGELEEMMADPRYRDPMRRDPEFVKRVDAGFKNLYDKK